MPLADLVPAMLLADSTGLGELANRWLMLPGYFGANAGLKVTAPVAGMLADPDSIDDMVVLRHGRMKKLFVGAYAPSTLGSFLHSFTLRREGTCVGVPPHARPVSRYLLVAGNTG